MTVTCRVDLTFFVEWLRAKRRYVHIARKCRKKLLSSSFSQCLRCLWRRNRKRSRRKSKYLHPRAHWYLAKDDQWGWTSTSHSDGSISCYNHTAFDTCIFSHIHYYCIHYSNTLLCLLLYRCAYEFMCNSYQIIKENLKRSYYLRLYFASFSYRACGSRVFRRPKRVLETASVAPIIGFNTAMGTARTTALVEPYKNLV